MKREYWRHLPAPSPLTIVDRAGEPGLLREKRSVRAMHGVKRTSSKRKSKAMAIIVAMQKLLMMREGDNIPIPKANTLVSEVMEMEGPISSMTRAIFLATSP